MKDIYLPDDNRKKKDDEIIALKNDVAEMKQLLKKLVDDKNGG